MPAAKDPTYRSWCRAVQDAIAAQSDIRDEEHVLNLLSISSIRARLPQLGQPGLGAMICSNDWGDLFRAIDARKPGGVTLEDCATLYTEAATPDGARFSMDLHAYAAGCNSASALGALLELRPLTEGPTRALEIAHLRVLQSICSSEMSSYPSMGEQRRHHLACAALLARARVPVTQPDHQVDHLLERQLFGTEWLVGCDDAFVDLIRIYRDNGMLDPHAAIGIKQLNLLDLALKVGNVGAVRAAIEIGTEVKPHHYEGAMQAQRNRDSLRALISDRLMRNEISANKAPVSASESRPSRAPAV